MERTWLAVLTGLYTGGIILNAVSEWFFWSEFGVRYNFIAVDYLVYTNEVVGNIMESYPVVPLFAGVLLLTVGCTWLLFRREIRRAGEFGTWQWKAAVSPAYLLLTLGCCLLLQFNTRFQQNAPSLSQAQRLKKLAQEGHFSYDVAFAVMGEPKKDELDKVVIKNDTLRKYFPESSTPREMEEKIIGLLEESKTEKVVFRSDSIKKYFPSNYSSEQIENSILKMLDQRMKKRKHEAER